MTLIKIQSKEEKMAVVWSAATSRWGMAAPGVWRLINDEHSFCALAMLSSVINHFLLFISLQQNGRFFFSFSVLFFFYEKKRNLHFGLSIISILSKWIEKEKWSLLGCISINVLFVLKFFFTPRAGDILPLERVHWVK